jgi:hypothetical protein
MLVVKRTVNFSRYTTNKIRINITAGRASYSRTTEIDVWAN